MNTVTRWKLVSLVLAGCMSYSWWQGGRDGEASSTSTAASTRRLTGPLRVSASALGISTDDLVRRMFAAKQADELGALAQRLGVVGDDAAIDAVLPLVHDPKCPAPEAIVAAFGAIASDHAVDVLAELSRDRREFVANAAVDALGVTKSKLAEPVLIELATTAHAETQRRAIAALGAVAGEAGIAALARLAAHPDDSGEHAMRALAQHDDPRARAAVVSLVDAASLRVVASAIGELQDRDLDAVMVARLTSIARGGESELVSPALAALAKAGPPGIAVVRGAALDGGLETRLAAIGILAEVAGDDAVGTLRMLLETEEGRIADEAARALGRIDSDEAREALIAAALAADDRSPALDHLLRQTGPEVEQALLVIAKSDGFQRWEAVEALVREGNPEAMRLAVAHGSTGEPEQRLAAMQALADARTPEAIDALLGLVEGSGTLKPSVLELIADARPDDPRVGALLADAARSHVPQEAAAAASALAKVGTDAARDALVAALASANAEVAANAAASLGKFRATDEVASALRAAIAAHPQLAPHVMTQLVDAGSPLGLELAKRAIDGDDAELAYRALSVLERAGMPGVVDVLVQATKVADPNLRAEAVATLVTTGDKRAVDHVAHALRDSAPTVRAAAARTLGQLGTAGARDLLLTMTRSSDGDDRAAAVTSLRRFGDDTTGRRLGELVRDPDPSVASAAITAIADRDDAAATLRGFVADRSADYDLRRRAALQLSYRGYTDPVVDELVAGE